MNMQQRPVTSQRVRFLGGAGADLGGQLDLPEGTPAAYAVFAPCFTCRKDAKAIVRISKALAERGVGVLRYDVTGIGDSDGDFAATTFVTQVEDLKAAARYLETSHGAPSLALGISLGGAVALVGAPRLEGVKGVVVVNAPSNLGHLRRTLLRIAPELEQPDRKTGVTLLGQRTRVGSDLVADLGNHSVLQAAAGLDRPLLVAVSTADEIVPAANGEEIFAAAMQPKSLIAIPGADHLMLRRPAVASWVGRMVMCWFEGLPVER